MLAITKQPKPDQVNVAQRELYERKCYLAAFHAIKRGVMEKDSVVLDVGCRSPKNGMFHMLYKRIGWRGQYVGVGSNIPPEYAKIWNDAHLEDPKKNPVSLRPFSLEMTREQLLAGKGLPFPPNSTHPYKEIAVAFCIDALKSVKAKDVLMQDIKGVATQIVVVGGVTEQDLDRWEFQFTGHLNMEGVDEWIGIWYDDRALRRYRIKNAIPDTTIGHFAAKDRRGMYPQLLGVCRNCGQPDMTNKSRFGCVHCGHDNTVRRMKYRKTRTHG